MELETLFGVDKWDERSFLLELKPNSSQASLYVACPREDCPTGEGGVKVERERLSTSGRTSGELRGLRLAPETLSKMSWAEGSGQALFTASLSASTPDVYLGAQSSFVLSRQIRGSCSLDGVARQLEADGGSVHCRHCDECLLQSTKGLGPVSCLPSDDWLESGVADGLSFFCGDACGHGHEASSAEQLPAASAAPSQGLLLADSHFLLSAPTSAASLSLCEAAEGLLECEQCGTAVGRRLRHGPKDLYRLLHSAARIRLGATNMLERRFGSEWGYFAWLLLDRCHQSSSLKLLIKTLDGSPRLLVWLLDAYVVMASGRLAEADATPVKPFTALRLLYHVYTPANAVEDPKARGEDASVFAVEESSAGVAALSSALLASTAALPPSARSLGTFMRGFLPIALLDQIISV